MTHAGDITLPHLEMAAAGEREHMHMHMHIADCGLSDRSIVAGPTVDFRFRDRLCTTLQPGPFR